MKASFKHYRRVVTACRTPTRGLLSIEEGGDFFTVYSQAGGPVFHYRRGVSEWDPNEKGGVTFCYLSEGHGEDYRVIGVGMAVCSKKDQFSYKRGREIAYERALRDATERRLVWKIREGTTTQEDAESVLALVVTALGLRRAREIFPELEEIYGISTEAKVD